MVAREGNAEVHLVEHRENDTLPPRAGRDEWPERRICAGSSFTAAKTHLLPPGFYYVVVR